MQQEDQLWHLLARQLTGDASAEEINALEKLIEDDPEIKNLVAVVSCFFQAPIKEYSHEIQIAWKKQEQRLI